MKLPFTKKTAETKASAAGGLLALTGLARAKWTGRRYDTQVEEGFRKNVIVWRCINLVAEAVATIPLVLYDARGKIIDKHPLLNLLARPNPTMTGADFMAAIATTWQLAGNVYLEALLPDDVFAASPETICNMGIQRIRRTFVRGHGQYLKQLAR